MSRDQLIFQLEECHKDLSIQTARALKYYSAYNYLMEHFNELHNDTRKEIDKRLREIGL